MSVRLSVCLSVLRWLMEWLSKLDLVTTAILLLTSISCRSMCIHSVLFLSIRSSGDLRLDLLGYTCLSY